MDRLILREKLESLRRCIARVEEKKPSSLAALEGDLDLQDILVLNLTRAVQICVDLGSHIISEADAAAPQSMGEVFAVLARLGIIEEATALNLRKSVGFRNIAVHHYEAIDWEIVLAICERSLEDFRTFARAVSRRFLDAV